MHISESVQYIRKTIVMVEIVLDEEMADILKEISIEPFSGMEIQNFKAGNSIYAREGDTIEAFTRHPSKLLQTMGAFSYSNGNIWTILNAKFGRYCSIASQVHILEGKHPVDAVSTSPYHYSVYYGKSSIPEEYVYKRKTVFNHSYGRTLVGNDVWIGSHTTIRAGIKIGDGAVIAGGSNVTKDVPPFAIVGGNPAKIIRYRFSDEICSRLLASQWWDVSPAILSKLDMSSRTRQVGPAMAPRFGQSRKSHQGRGGGWWLCVRSGRGRRG